MINFQRNYFDCAYNPDSFFTHFKEAVEVLNPDSIVGIGISGALVVPILAREFKLNFALARKPGVSSHSSGRPIEGKIEDKWMFVDDFMSSGSTFRTVYQRVLLASYYEKQVEPPEFVGAFLYSYPTYRHAKWFRTMIKVATDDFNPERCDNV